MKNSNFTNIRDIYLKINHLFVNITPKKSVNIKLERVHYEFIIQLINLVDYGFLRRLSSLTLKLLEGWVRDALTLFAWLVSRES